MGNGGKVIKADIKLGYSCNNDCVHCVISDHRNLVFARGLPEDIPEEKYRQELKDSRTRANAVVFTGGEPTIRKELLDLVAYARDLGYKISMQTNGRRLSRMDFAQALCGIVRMNYTIALHGPRPEIHDAVTRAPGSFYETVQGIRNVLELSGNSNTLSGKLVISKINAPHLTDTIRFMENLGLKSVSLTFPHACGNARKNFYDVVPRYRDIREEVINAIYFCLTRGITVKTEALMFCHIPGAEFVVGELEMIDAEYSELKQYGMDDVVNWQTMRPEIKKKSPFCKYCRYDKICEGPWMEYPDYYDFDDLIPVPGRPVEEHCEVAQKNRRNENRLSAAYMFRIDNCQ